MLAPKLIIEPETQLVVLADAKLHVRVDFPDDDDLILALIVSATMYLDGYSGILGRALITQTWSQQFSRFCDGQRLAVGDVTTITSIKYFDSDNVEQTLDASVYEFFTDQLGPYVALKPGQVWPASYNRIDAVTIAYVAGYGDADDVPGPIKQAILMMVGHHYQHRETASSMKIEELPFSVSALIAPFRRIQV